MSERRGNRLSTETSPYLLQHACNPVDWYPWGEEAFREARTQDKPILLSVGYSSCHWCHVMERESFENEEIARLMNEQFVNIKVDREERPDIDAFYMDYVQLTTGHGGWPLTVFLAPDRTPFYGGTYFPPVDRYGRPGFKTVLSRVAGYYHSRKSEISASQSDISSWMREGQVLKFEPGPLDPNVLDRASDALLRSFDPSYGGFGGAPKFPSSMALRFLLRFDRRRGSSAAREAVSVSLHRMAAGGIYDQLGGGFHRYSVDDRWLVPHFEKMLYDNALLVRLYLEAFQATGESYFREVVEQTLAYVQRDLTDPSGGFYSAEDADSEGEEGRFYVWQHAEVSSVLDSEAAKLFCDFYDVSDLGNWEGRNILNRRRSLPGLAREKALDIDAARERLDHARRRLLDVRLRRPRPGLDNKIIASWNGLMLAAFAEAGFVLNTGPFLETAKRNAAFLLDKLCRSGRLLRIWTQGTAKVQGFLEDYAHVVEGLLALYEASGETRWLEGAVSLTETQLQLFSNPESDLLYSTSTEHEQLMIRRTDFQDNAVPSGNSTTAGNLLRLAILTGETAYRERAERMLGRIVEPASRYPLAFGNWLTVLDFCLGPVSEMVCIGDPGKREDLLEPLRRRFLPNKVLVLSERPEQAARLVPLLAGKPAAGDPVVYLCRGYTCRQPVTEAADLVSLLEAEN